MHFPFDPVPAPISGILTLIIPRLLNGIVGIYLILYGLLGRTWRIVGITKERDFPISRTCIGNRNLQWKT